MDSATKLRHFQNLSNYAKEHGTLLRVYHARPHGRPGRPTPAAASLAAAAGSLSVVLSEMYEFVASGEDMEAAYAHGRSVPPPPGAADSANCNCNVLGFQV